MAILTPSDQSAFFPDVTATSPALDVFCAIAQAYCEGLHGANRPLCMTEFTEVSPVWSASEAVARLSMHPVSSIVEVQSRTVVQNYGRSYPGEFQTVDIDSYRFESTTGEVQLLFVASEIKVRYFAGYDFSSTTDPDVQKIKGIAGAVLSHMFSHSYGQLASHMDNPTGLGIVSKSFPGLDTYLKAALLPLKFYGPRPSDGMVSSVPVPIAIGGFGS